MITVLGTRAGDAEVRLGGKGRHLSNAITAAAALVPRAVCANSHSWAARSGR